MKAPIVLVAVLAGAVGCKSGRTTYTPHDVAPGELVLSYDDEYVVSANDQPVARSSDWAGLEDFVGCVPAARDHAASAETIGTTAKVLSVTGPILGVSSLGTLASLAVVDKEPKLTAAVLGAGAGAAALGMVLALIGRRLKSHGNGHAIDAMNLYNDQLGRAGGRCRKKP